MESHASEFLKDMHTKKKGETGATGNHLIVTEPAMGFETRDPCVPNTALYQAEPVGNIRLR